MRKYQKNGSQSIEALEEYKRCIEKGPIKSLIYI